MVSNLLSNAIKFTQRGGVTVSVRRVRINHRLMVEITVVDTGIGMEPHQVEAAFEPFVQLSESNSREHRGLGLGLALVSRNAKALGATLEVTSKPATGSRFTVRLAQSQR
jgi:signal transduction histidine kinase